MSQFSHMPEFLSYKTKIINNILHKAENTGPIAVHDRLIRVIFKNIR